MGIPKYKTTEKSLEYFIEKTGYSPEFIAYARDEESWQELFCTNAFPHEEFYNAYGQLITYDSTRKCPGKASRFVKALGSDGLHVEVIKNRSVEDLLEKLEFAPEMVFDPVELGDKYDYAMYIFFYSGMIPPNIGAVAMELDSVLANNTAEIAIVPVCMDGNTNVFKKRRDFKRTFFSMN